MSTLQTGHGASEVQSVTAGLSLFYRFSQAQSTMPLALGFADPGVLGRDVRKRRRRHRRRDRSSVSRLLQPQM